ncbi:helix-turn-helix domain-containing protein [Collinsella sp. AGMB00827]|uniref:Helix-turn-helix domain-containing protein n=1 Tax=Collinsella ureilytica TaxID=2869515 RepID=A0ABS7MHC0_9ACTN|nr:helix-turn-helix domain-containing protein [Collinsella urealyticum]
MRYGLPRKPLYSVTEISRVLGIKYATLNAEVNAGRLKSHLPAGRRQGRLVRPEWVDAWIEAGTHGN